MAILEGSLRTTRSEPSGVPAPSRISRGAVLPVAAALLGFTISVIGIGTPAIWYDEAATITAATRSWPQLWAMIGNVDAVHALYYSLIHIIFDVFGYSPLALRLPSAVAVGATALLVVILARQLGRPRIAWIAAVVFCVLPRVTWMGTEGRSYAFTALLAVALTVVLVRSLRSGGRWWILYSALAALSVTLFIYLAFVVVAHAATVIFYRRRFVGFVLSAGAAAIVTLPFALATIAQSGQVAWIDPISAATVERVFVVQWFLGSLPFAVVAWVLIAIGVIALIRRRDVALPTLLPVLVLPTLALIVVSLIVAPTYQPRYLTMGVPFAALTIAYGIDALRSRIAMTAALAVLVALALPQIAAQRQPEAKENSSWSQVADLIASERAMDAPGTSTAIIYGNLQRHPSATTRVIEYSYPAAFAGTIDVTLHTPAAETAQLWETRDPIDLSLSGLAHADVAYLITSVARDLRPETTAALARVGWHIAQTWEFTSIHVIRYERD